MVEIPEFLPDGPLNLPLELNNLPYQDIPGIPKRLNIPLFRRDDKTLAYFVTSGRPVDPTLNPTLPSLYQ
ncbi:jg19115 [Pararge aegeria aegeria]|uniref:Jg19115 protein n=2 Tax=Pararge aegeria TaxID=116150 RepID=A0A8S4QUE9_9NEOP|nr:jg19115 [Pararge aegeria aegeria]